MEQVYIYLLRLDDLCPLHVDQLADGFLYGVELAAVTGRVETVRVCLNEDREESSGIER